MATFSFDFTPKPLIPEDVYTGKVVKVFVKESKRKWMYIQFNIELFGVKGDSLGIHPAYVSLSPYTLAYAEQVLVGFGCTLQQIAEAIITDTVLIQPDFVGVDVVVNVVHSRYQGDDVVKLVNLKGFSTQQILNELVVKYHNLSNWISTQKYDMKNMEVVDMYSDSVGYQDLY